MRCPLSRPSVFTLRERRVPTPRAALASRGGGAVHGAAAPLPLFRAVAPTRFRGCVMVVELDAEPIWSDERVEQLKRHHAMGLSAAASADLIGSVSRNAVISKRRRLGLMGANPLRSAMLALRKVFHAAQVDRQPKPAACRSGLVDDERLPREPLPFMDFAVPPDANPKILADREVGECAWPLGPAEQPADYRTLFCGAPVARGQTYCAAHRANAFSGCVLPPLRVRPSKRP